HTSAGALKPGRSDQPLEEQCPTVHLTRSVCTRALGGLHRSFPQRASAVIPTATVMASVELPTKEECESWSHTQVANFLYQYGMQECSATARKLKIDGNWLLNLSDSDLSRFSLIYQ
ncbi:hypothetical protein AAFF_G00137240, partial [Aldrovandia affinis]